jgi:serine/threonine-protein kinase RsbW/sigma-B regulation protein RsbU (phosphoserine phosphatase)
MEQVGSIDSHFAFKFLRGFAHRLDKIEEKTKSLFVAVAIVLYVGSLVLLARKVNPLTDFDGFLVKALANLSIPFGVILLQELLELLTTIPTSALRSAAQQFEIVALVILRSFFKDFYKLNKAVALGEFSEPVQIAVVKIASLVLITILIITFNRLSARAGVERRHVGRANANLLRQFVVFLLCALVAVYMVVVERSFDVMTFISIVFTGMIVLDAVFFLWMIPQNHEFDSLIFDGNLVVSLIFARFPLFAANLVTYPLAVIGVALATGGLRLFIRPTELRFLGNPQEDEVARLDLTITNDTREIPTVNKKCALFLKQFSVPDEIAKKVRLSCDELLNNVISYAYDDEREHEINMSLALCEGRLAITISDDGKAFNPFRQEVPDTEISLEEREVGGLGVFLVRNVMDKVAYHRQTGKNVVTLLKWLDARPDAGVATGA